MTTSLAEALPRTLPESDSSRLLLFAVRRMGAHGLDDAHVAGAFLAEFCAQFRRPLLLVRTFMAELSATSTCTIAIAPCCCARMTAAEASLLDAVAAAEFRPDFSQLLFQDLLAVRRPDGVRATAALLAAAFADAGRPLG